MKRTSIWLIASVLSVLGATAQVVPGRFIVELSGEPAVTAVKRGASRAARDYALEARRRTVYAQQIAVQPQIEAHNARVLNRIQNLANAVIVAAPPDAKAALQQIPGVKRVYEVHLRKPLMDHAVNVVHAADAWAAIGGNQFAGKGTRIGIIDTGIDSTHPAFQDPGLQMPDGYPQVNDWHDRQYANSKIIVARNYDPTPGTTPLDTTGHHGTAVAMVAAGEPNAGPYGVITGIAPKAQLGNYKVFPDDGQGAPDDLIIKAMDDAFGDHMDVINLSLGSLWTERPDFDLLVQAVERATAAGIVVVTAAGNEGPGLNTIGSPASAPSAITVGNTANERAFSAQVTVDGIGNVLAVPGQFSDSASPVTAPVTDVATLDKDGLACSALPAASLTGKIALILRGTCVFQDKLTNAQKAGAVAALVYTQQDRPDVVVMSLDSAVIPAEMISYEDGLKIKNQITANAATTATMSFTQTPYAVTPWKLSTSSSRGPSMDTIKPDLGAVGSNVYTAQPSANGKPGYAVLNGTSFSSPMVAGAVALVKAQRPGLTPEQYKSLLVNTASTFTPDGQTTPMNVQMVGSGELNVAAALNATAAVDPVSISFGSGPSNADAFGVFTLSNVSKTDDTYTISVSPVSGSAAPVILNPEVQLPGSGAATVILRFTGPELTPGPYQGFIVVHSARTGTDIRLPYWYGVSSHNTADVLVIQGGDSGTTYKPGSTHWIVLRTLDEFGIPILVAPEIAVTHGDGTVVSDTMQNVDDDIPGAFAVQVKLGQTPGAYTYTLKSGGITRDITYNVN